MPSYKKINDSVVECTVKRIHATSCHVTLPFDWIGRRVRIELLEEKEAETTPRLLKE